ncbi:hypothetical protein PoB_004611200 [Plakobranchus ocellatus]|uniref:Uncharacterized protein n=1 Tax=Plakobranchus ocellatus TaxID=259542 RepID=A0AAV4BL09_9GAST|nr:hypothetical protein PoB_004611200 [Plakobranchus ocellatus]
MKSTAKIIITWYDTSMYNFGQYTKFKNYAVATDPIWKRSLDERAARSRLITSKTQSIETSAKPKRLKISESALDV